jgi:MraZ protein
MLFWGCHDHVLDDKGRTSLPKTFRESFAQLDGTPWLIAMPRCLGLLPDEEFQRRQSALREYGGLDSAENIQRLIIGMADPCLIDRQGRMGIPPKLRAWARLSREIVITGVGAWVEIWDRTRHADMLEHAASNYPAFSREMRRQEP